VRVVNSWVQESHVLIVNLHQNAWLVVIVVVVIFAVRMNVLVHATMESLAHHAKVIALLKGVLLDKLVAMTSFVVKIVVNRVRMTVIVTAKSAVASTERMANVPTLVFVGTNVILLVAWVKIVLHLIWIV
jgi:hypothetical protein